LGFIVLPFRFGDANISRFIFLPRNI
jgi:hypothetical protein